MDFLKENWQKIAAAILLALAVVFLVRRGVGPGPGEQGVGPGEGEEMTIVPDREEVDGVMAGEDVEKTTLTDVAGGNTSGEAARVFTDGKFYHRVTAENLKQPGKGYFYEGWLINGGGQYFSTGPMEVYENGNGLLDYASLENKSEYNKVVITYEPDDGNPEPATHILEGSFE